MEFRNNLVSANKFVGITLFFGLLVSVLIATFGFTKLRTSFAINGMEIEHGKLYSLEPSDKIHVYFNKDVDHGFQEGNANLAHGNVDFREVIVKKIANARSTIDLAVMYLFDPVVVQSLKEADARGVKVRIITDHEGLAELNNLLGDTKIEVKDNNGGVLEEGLTDEKSIMHYKFAVIDHAIPDSAAVLTSSANWSEKGFDINSNNLVVIENQDLAQAYMYEYEQMWSGKFNRDKDLRTNRGAVFEIDGRVVELWMSPSADPFTSFEMRYVNLIEEAKKSIYFATFNFTLPRISQALEEKFIEGLDIKGLSNDGSWDILRSAYFDMRGIYHTKEFTPWKKIPYENIRHDAMEGEISSLHYKYFVIDEEIVATGASNPTTSAVFTNDEDILIIHDPLIANEFKQNFLAHFQKYGGTTKNSKIKITDFDDENDRILLKNLTGENIYLKNWRFLSTDEVLILNEYFPVQEFIIEDDLVLKAGGRIEIQLPPAFINNDSEDDEFMIRNSNDDGEIYLFDENDLLQNMIWY